MIPSGPAADAVILIASGGACASVIAQADGGVAIDTLIWIDRLLLAAAAGIVAVAIAHRSGGRADSKIKDEPPQLRGAPELFGAVPILCYLSALLLLSALIGAPGGSVENGEASPTADSVRTMLVLGNGSQLAGLAGCLMVAGRLFPGGLGAFVLGRSTGRSATLVLASGVIVLGVCPMIGDASARIFLHFGGADAVENHPTIDALHEGTLSTGVVALLWIGAVVVAPLAEEFFFRGVLPTFLQVQIGGVSRSIILASIAFALVHTGQPFAMPALFVLGLILGYLRERTGSLVGPVLLHAAFNFKTLLWDYLARSAS